MFYHCIRTDVSQKVFFDTGRFDGSAETPGMLGVTEGVGVKLTPAGAPFPYGKDPADRNIRIAPTYPTLPALRQALEVLAVCLQLATVQQLLGNDGT